jgi:hypothetical protein
VGKSRSRGRDEEESPERRGAVGESRSLQREQESPERGGAVGERSSRGREEKNEDQKAALRHGQVARIGANLPLLYSESGETVI